MTARAKNPVRLEAKVRQRNKKHAYESVEDIYKDILVRNSFTGPGFRNLDVSLAKSFPIRWLGDAASIQLRADFFNVLNHANLGPPLVGPAAYGQFGQAFFGYSAAPPGNVSFVPLDEIPRRIELQLRVRF